MRIFKIRQVEALRAFFFSPLAGLLRGPRMPDKPRSDLNKYLNAPHFVHSRGGIKRHNANKLNNSDGIRNIQSRLFYIHVTMELSRLNDWGGRQHDSPTPMNAHTHTHIAKCNCGSFSGFRFLWPQLWKCSVGDRKGNTVQKLEGMKKENKWAKDRGA